MPGIALLDVNVLVALFHPDHVHHEIAHDWFADHGHDGWATCPVTENGFVRVAAQASGDAMLQPGSIVDLFRKFCSSGHHHFWADTVSLRDRELFNLEFIGGHRQVTDVYLLGLATKMEGRLATFDRTIPFKAVTGAKRDTLQVIAPAE